MNSNLKEKFEAIYGKDGEIRTFFCPGRVNLIGEHIDYNGGFVFPAALTIGITAVCRKRNDNVIRLRSMNAEGEVSVDINGPIAYDEKDDWANYPKGVFNHLKKEGYTLVGCDILYSSNLPNGAGLSSSAAIEVVTGFMMLTITGKKDIDKVWLSTFSQGVENNYVGVNCGIMDQFSEANGKADHAILLNCETLDYKLIPFKLKGYALVIMNTNKRRELADSKYNERRSECDNVLELLNKNNNHYANLCEASLDQVNTYIKDEILKKRARHVITENERVLQSVDVLSKGDIKAFGILLNGSHKSLKEDYEVTGKELDAIVEESVKAEGCLGARMTGAGFGGCAIAIVENAHLKEFQEKVAKGYKEKTGLTPVFYVSDIGNGVHEVK